MPDLITRDELLNALNVAPGDVTPQQDSNYDQSIAGASVAVSNYCDRDFASPVVTEQRTFEYDGSGFLELDDCTAVTAVTFSSYGVDSVISADEWVAEPARGAVYTYLLLPAHRGFGSPAMGFTRNLDVIAAKRGWSNVGSVKVDATWGWPTVPEDVKRAVIWTAAAAADKPGGNRSEALSSSGASYSYSRDTPGLPETPAIPERAKDFLAPYVRYKVG